MSKLQNDLFIRACHRQPVERTPIWIMRQAGRYLPEYRKVREKADFITMCQTPELAAEVTLQPVDIIGVDAAILFSDILVIPEAMGLAFEMVPGKGPVFHNTINSEGDASKLKRADVDKDLKYVLDAVSLTKKELNNRVPLIGFSGAPWTLLTYMVEGGSSKNFAKTKKMIYNNPKLAHKVLEMLSDSVADYLNAKLEAGVDAVQIFDTWGGVLDRSDFKAFSLNYIAQIISKLNRKNNEPVIVFAKGVHWNLHEIVEIGANVIGLDWTMNLGEVRKLTDDKVALQGNMDPTVLYAPKTKIEEKAKQILESYGKGNGHIFNLGHGILPDVAPENAKALVNYIKQESVKYH